MRDIEIVIDPEILSGEPHLEGTRISAWKIHDMCSMVGMSPEEIADELPTVDVEGVKAALEYVENQDEKTKSPVKA
ncbi:MAG: hypothetical protein BRC29_01275 [Nanohaloarchaea archaeon SW_7_43_1]|nr:MAG: hypothetical protein BRC29_01275 [Nanohaloarchaea archaeon SW_7_43_1]